MRSILLLAFFLCIGVLATPPDGVRADQPSSFLRLGDASRVSCTPGDATVEIRTLRASGVKEITAQLLHISEGVSRDLNTTRLRRADSADPATPVSGQLVLLLTPTEKEGEKYLLPSLGLQFEKDAFGGKSSGEKRLLRTSARTVEVRSPAAELREGKAVIVYAQGFGSKDREEEGYKLAGKSVEEVVKLSKRHTQLSYLVVVISWSGTKGK